MSKKLGSLSDLGGFVFSTNDDFNPSEGDSIETVEDRKSVV